MSNRTRQPANADGAASPSPAAASDPPAEPVKVCKWDGTAVKNALDDGVKEVLTGKLGYVEDHSLMDGRLWICGVAVIVALFALLWDYLHPFPASRTVLISCVATYFVLMSILTVYTTYKEKGIFVVTRQRDPAGCDPDSKWEASSSMKKFDDVYELGLVFVDGRTRKRREASVSHSCAEFYDENGVLCADILERAVLKLHRSLASDKKDS